VIKTQDNCDDMKAPLQQVAFETSRRSMLRRGVGFGAVALALTSSSEVAVATEQNRAAYDPRPTANKLTSGGDGWIVTNDGTKIFYKDWSSGQPVVFSHGWPLQADVWDPQMMFLGSNGFRVLAHDRRSHGRSTQTWMGNDLDTYADDLATLIEKRKLSNVILVGHSTGAGEVARYIGRHGTQKVAKVVLISTITPQLLKTSANPKGVPKAAFDGIHAGIFEDRSQYYKDLSVPFFGGNRPNAKISQGIKDSFWLWSMQVGLKGAYDCLTSSSEANFTDDLKRIDRPTLLIHGGDDQIVPIEATAVPTSQIVTGSHLKIYKGAPHGLFATNQEQLNADLLTFAKT
jgi:non-heme chloroperoxidase